MKHGPLALFPASVVRRFVVALILSHVVPAAYADATAYFPLTTGNFWALTASATSATGQSFTASAAETVLPSSKTVNGVATKIVSAGTFEEYLTNDGEGLRRHGFTYTSLCLSSSDCGVATYTLSSPIVIIPNDLVTPQSGAGTASFVYSGVTNQSGQYSYTYSTTFASDSVTTSFGSVAAIRVTLTLTMAGVSGTSISWYAPGMGLVKLVMSFYGISAQMLLTAYRITDSFAATFALINVRPGWNLLGNSTDQSITIGDVLNSAAITTVWKWVPSIASWAFFSPALTDRGQGYAASKGYFFLTTINPGEGFWVNANSAITFQLPSGNPIQASSFQTMPTGWNLIAIGDNKTPSGFNKAISLTPPSPGTVPTNFTTLWAWDNAQANWYFYAPSLEKSGTLLSYITSKTYLEFGSKPLDPSTGFWVNK